VKSAASASPSPLWWIVTTTDAAALREGWKEIARKWARLWPNGRQM
jgi:hypothetical protein